MPTRGCIVITAIVLLVLIYAIVVRNILSDFDELRLMTTPANFERTTELVGSCPPNRLLLE